MKYGFPPADLGLIDLNPVEMMFWMYCPIKDKNSHTVELPDNLQQYQPIINHVYRDVKMDEFWNNEFVNRWYKSYVYITAKTLWVSGDYIGNRPGWHSDGFGTNDINYIWCDRAPTEFLITKDPFTLSTDCDISMREMEYISRREQEKGNDPVVYEDKHLLKLTPAVIHRSPVNFAAGMRSFVKISISSNFYNLEGNSINHQFDFNLKFEMQPRQEQRNHPTRF